jgi:RimJ/RimL family protein N-acetyltransferase
MKASSLESLPPELCTEAYPHEWMRDACTLDNVRYRIRPIRSDDAERELAFIQTLSQESLYNRMLCGYKIPSAEQLEHWVHIDYRLQMAFVAVVGDANDEHIIGIARYCTDGDHRGEYAIAIADAWQDRGVGTTLSHLLFDYARMIGIVELHAVMLSTNHRMVDLARSLGMRVSVDQREPRLVCGSVALDRL